MRFRPQYSIEMLEGFLDQPLNLLALISLGPQGGLSHVDQTIKSVIYHDQVPLYKERW